MTITVRARFANGLLTPLEPLDAPEGSWVTLSIEGAESPEGEAAPAGKDIAPDSGGRPEAPPNSAYLEEALQDLNEVTADAEEDGLDIPSDLAFKNAERLLRAMYGISPRRYGVYPDYDGYITIDARGPNDRIAVVMCGSDGGALCLVTIDNEPRRARYSTARQLPDGFIREALLDLGKESA